MKTFEVTDFGMNLETLDMDGYVTCECGKETHFVIKRGHREAIDRVFKREFIETQKVREAIEYELTDVKEHLPEGNVTRQGIELVLRLIKLKLKLGL